eukprot:1160013-Pyramimonas_sp.AAC.1
MGSLAAHSHFHPRLEENSETLRRKLRGVLKAPPPPPGCARPWLPLSRITRQSGACASLSSRL